MASLATSQAVLTTILMGGAETVRLGSSLSVVDASTKLLAVLFITMMKHAIIAKAGYNRRDTCAYKLSMAVLFIFLKLLAHSARAGRNY